MKTQRQIVSPKSDKSQIAINNGLVTAYGGGVALGLQYEMGHQWEYPGEPWLKVYRFCKGCKRKEFFLECWSKGLWISSLDEVPAHYAGAAKELAPQLYASFGHIKPSPREMCPNATDEAVNALMSKERSCATVVMRQCGAIFPYDPKDEQGGGGTTRDTEASKHAWKFFAYTEDGEPQGKKCTKCKYTLWFNHCVSRWFEGTSQSRHLGVRKEYGGFL